MLSVKLWPSNSLYVILTVEYLHVYVWLYKLLTLLLKFSIVVGIVKTDWLKYVEYIADPSKRKQQFQSLSARQWQTSSDQYKFRYFRDHPVDLPTPPLPGFVSEAIQTRIR